ncbi:MAG: methionine--tRNA ligase [Candidatus Paceibacterota bacterium]
MSKNFYITSPIFYPNAKLHMGHAYTMTLCDILARYHKLINEDTYFLAGADENTGKVTKAAAEKGQTLDVFLGEITKGFKKLYLDLDISFDQFIQTTDKENHWPGAIAVWNKLVASDDIYKNAYEGLYCQNCEAFYTDKDLIDGKCPMHGTLPEKIKEENYFFRLSKYTSQLKSKIEKDELKITPESRKNEILALFERGLQDVSFSRPIANVPHGIPVPGDPTQVIYVWCDALVNYISALGYGKNENELFKKFWPADVQVIGKDILRFHAAIWPAMLLSSGLPLPKNLFVHGFITSGGKKMSKSVGNVIDPISLIDEYGKDALRYYLAREISPFEDGDITVEKFKESYNANLANGLGNLVSRVMKMAESYGVTIDDESSEFWTEKTVIENLETFNIQKYCDEIWNVDIKGLDEYIQREKPFSKIKIDKAGAEKDLKYLLIHLRGIAMKLQPILPETAEKILKLIKENKSPEAPLFARKD